MQEATRTGLIARKVGMSRYFSADGFHIPVTLLKVENCQVISSKTKDKHGYNAVQVGEGAIKVKNVSKSMRGVFAKAKVEPKRRLAEFRVQESGLLNPGDELSAEHFVAGQFVDVCGVSKGKGFAGGMKRHNFGGLEATHGISISHRSHGSTGQCQDPGRVFKGKKMAGHLGHERVTIQNMEVVETRADEGLILINGAVPGAKGDYVLISDAIKKALPADAPFPAGLKGVGAPAANDSADAEDGKLEGETAAPAEENAKEDAKEAKSEKPEASEPAAESAEQASSSDQESEKKE